MFTVRLQCADLTSHWDHSCILLTSLQSRMPCYWFVDVALESVEANILAIVLRHFHLIRRWGLCSVVEAHDLADQLIFRSPTCGNLDGPWGNAYTLRVDIMHLSSAFLCLFVSRILSSRTSHLNAPTASHRYIGSRAWPRGERLRVYMALTLDALISSHHSVMWKDIPCIEL